MLALKLVAEGIIAPRRVFNFDTPDVEYQSLGEWTKGKVLVYRLHSLVCIIYLIPLGILLPYCFLRGVSVFFIDVRNMLK